MRRSLTALLLAFTLTGCVTPESDTTTYDDTSYDEPDSGGTDDFDVPDADIADMALDITWDNMPFADRQTICDGIDVLGVDFAVDQFMSGADSGDFQFDPSTVRSWLLSNCA